MDAEALAKQFLKDNNVKDMDDLDIDEQQGFMGRVFDRKQKDIAKMFHDTFKSEQGERVLRHLVSKHVFAPTINPNDDMVSAGIREGQKRLVLWIMQQIERAEKG